VPTVPVLVEASANVVAPEIDFGTDHQTLASRIVMPDSIPLPVPASQTSSQDASEPRNSVVDLPF
jgi:hypothetical protein